MERRFRVRLDELLNDAEVAPGLLRGVMPRLESFLQPFVESLCSPEQQTNAKQYVSGLLSDLNGKDIESIAYLHDRERQGLQKFMGQSEWDHEPLLRELVEQVGTELGEADGVLVFDPSVFPKKGTESVGVQRQWCGRLGKLDNCQVGIYLGYVSRKEQALVDVRLYLPKEWANTKRRRQKAGAPAAVRFRTRHELILEMLDERGSSLPHAWLSGDDELGRSSWFRQQLQARGECYLLAVPSNTLVRDLTEPDPPYGGRGLIRKHPSAAWIAGAPRCRRTPGRRSTYAMGRKGQWWCRRSGPWCRREPKASRRRWPSFWSCSASGKRTALGSTITCCRWRRCQRPWRSSPACSKPSIALKNAWSGPRAKRVWPTIRCAPGKAGTTIRRCRSSLPGSSRGKPGGEKIQTPALTVPQVQTMIAGLLNQPLHCNRPAQIRRTMNRRLKRNEEARLYHWRRHNRLPPRRFEQRT